ncbi:MAG: nucleotide exchange factor GrpE [Fibrobacteria bacterium]|nr:nucleotide exchange factor GrpE [Fibrobacteria bacterium]
MVEAKENVSDKEQSQGSEEAPESIIETPDSVEGSEEEAAEGVGEEPEKTEGEAKDKTEEDGTEEDSCDYSDDENEELSEEEEGIKEKYLRLYAEFENFRKRTAKESLQLIQTAQAGLMEKLIPTLETFEMAFSPEQKAKKLEDFEAGIKMIFNKFKDVLEEAGLEEINPEGEEFDPNFHEAIMQQPHDTLEEDHIVQVYQKGYKVKTKILKHAKVIVAKGKE